MLSQPHCVSCKKLGLNLNYWKCVAFLHQSKLEEAVGKAENFHIDLNHFIGWLTEMEKNLTTLKPVSRVMDTIVDQIEEHKVLI